MRLRSERRLAHPRQQRAEARVAREIRAQHQGVHKEPDQPLELHPPAVRDRSSNANVRLPAVA